MKTKLKEKIKKKVWAKANRDWDYKEKDKWFPISASEVDKLIDLTIQKTAEEILKDIEKLPLYSYDDIQLAYMKELLKLTDEDISKNKKLKIWIRIEDLIKKWLED